MMKIPVKHACLSHYLAQPPFVRSMYVLIYLIHYFKSIRIPFFQHFIQSSFYYGKLLSGKYASISIRTCPRY